jgi:hypothetical protein
MIRSSVAIAAVWTLLVALALPAAAAEVNGESLLEGKNDEQMTLQLEDHLVVRVTDETHIYDADKRRISFAQIPLPTVRPSLVEYSGSLQGDVVVATRLVVREPAS